MIEGSLAAILAVLLLGHKAVRTALGIISLIVLCFIAWAATLPPSSPSRD